MQIVVIAIRFKDGAWKEYQHNCSKEEIEAVIDSTAAKAFERFRYRTPEHADFLAGASYVFNVARGTRDNPAEGDTLVLEVQISGKLAPMTLDREYVLENT
jgi:hypothetical protein